MHRTNIDKCGPSMPDGIHAAETSTRSSLLPKGFAANSIAQRSAARSRPRAEGCSSTSQARPLGCEAASDDLDAIRLRAFLHRIDPAGIGGPQLRLSKARCFCKQACPAGCGQNWE